uniref:DNA-binding protein n=1 Tax=Panagrellus redivivus TaxID=6233 RepID=A0A7E4UX57_PANRE
MATTQKLNFDEMFIVKEINAEGKKFAMTDRLTCKSESDAIELLLDVHSELFKAEVGTKFRAVIVNTFREDGLPDDDEYDPNVRFSYHFQLF